MPTQKIGLFRLVAAHGIGRRIDRLPDQGKPMREDIVTKIDHGLVSAAMPTGLNLSGFLRALAAR